MRAIAIAVCLVGCANNVPQDRSTGPDGKPKGAQAIKLENGEAVTKGIVTYPGGDRVDWKLVELPEGKSGRLELQMQWTTPRPGLQLGFDVFDQWNNPVANAKGSKGRSRDAFVDQAKGKYFVRVYAKGRGDAGAYKLAVAFREDVQVKIPRPEDLDIPDPPRLASVPEPDDNCETYDKLNQACLDKCPPGAPPHHPGCKGPTTPPGGTTIVTPPTPPTPPTPAKNPITARVIAANVAGDSTIITLPYGSEQGVDKTWTGQVMRGDTKQPFPGGKVTIIRVDKNRTIAKVSLTTDLVTSNPIVILTP